MKVYTIIGGVNGTGKSSLTGVLRAQRNDLGVIVDVDRITALADVSPLEGGKMAIRRIEDCLNKGISFTQESTLSGFRTAQTASFLSVPHGCIRLFFFVKSTCQTSYMSTCPDSMQSGLYSDCTVSMLSVPRGQQVNRCLKTVPSNHSYLLP